MKLNEIWGKARRVFSWIRKNEDGIAGTSVLVVCAFLAVLVLMDSDGNERKAPKKETAKESTTFRQDLSSMWHHTKCLVRFCDEDGRCPVWSSKYSKCYMLDKDGERVLRYYEREGARKEQIESWSPDLFGK